MDAETLYEEYLTTPWSEPSRREREFLDRGEPLLLPTAYGDVRGRRWPAEGGRRETVLLMHGWAGRGATWLVLAPLLNEAGYDVVAFDAPGHGETRGADGPVRSTFFMFAETLRAAEASLSDGASSPSIAAIVGHSLGACAIPYVLARGSRARRAVLIAPTARTESFLIRWAAARGASPEEEAGVHRLWHAEFGSEALARTDAVAEARRADVPALILHDAGDLEVPIEDGRLVAAAWSGSTFEETAGLGHRRILLSRPAMARVAAYVAESRRAPPEISGDTRGNRRRP